MKEATELVREAEEAAKAKGLSISELCRLSDVHRATWQRWKGGIVSPTIENWRRVEAVLATYQTPQEHAEPAEPQRRAV